MHHSLRSLLICGSLLLVSTSWCQQTLTNALNRPRLPGGFGSNFIERYVLSPEFRAEHRVTDAQAKKIKTELDALEKEVIRLETEVAGLARQQADAVRRLMDAPAVSEKELFTLIEKICNDRMAQAKIAMKRLVVIRNNLTPEQRKHAMNKLVEEYERRQQERMLSEKPPVVKFPPVLK